MIDQSFYLGCITFFGWFTFTYIVPKISERFNKIYYDHFYIQDERNDDIEYFNNKLYEIDIQHELKIKNVERLIESLEQKINYIDNVQDKAIYLNKNNISCDEVHIRNDKYSVFKKFYNPNLKNMNYFEKHMVNIPVGWWLTKKEIKQITTVINKY